jgi:hypothetical protein
MMHLLNFYWCPNISTSKVSPFSKILEDLFSEDYADADKIQVTSLQMWGKAKKWWIQMKKKTWGGNYKGKIVTPSSFKEQIGTNRIYCCWEAWVLIKEITPTI